MLWWKACSVFKPDYYVEYLPDNPWIHQPFEVYDNLPPDGLKARLARLSARGPAPHASRRREACDADPRSPPRRGDARGRALPTAGR